eukprot:3059231-Pyramimonas_sp.AAC.1
MEPLSGCVRVCPGGTTTVRVGPLSGSVWECPGGAATVRVCLLGVSAGCVRVEPLSGCVRVGQLLSGWALCL